MPPIRRVARLPPPGRGLTAEDMGTDVGIRGCIDDLNNLLRGYVIFFRNEDEPLKITYKNVDNARFLKKYHHDTVAFHEQHIEWVNEGQQTEGLYKRIQEGLREKLATAEDMEQNISKALRQYDWKMRVPWMVGAAVAAVLAPRAGGLAPVMGLQVAAAGRELIDAFW